MNIRSIVFRKGLEHKKDGKWKKKDLKDWQLEKVMITFEIRERNEWTYDSTGNNKAMKKSSKE